MWSSRIWRIGGDLVCPRSMPAQSRQATWFMYIATFFGKVCQLLNVRILWPYHASIHYRRFPLALFASLKLSPPLLERAWAYWVQQHSVRKWMWIRIVPCYGRTMPCGLTVSGFGSLIDGSPLAWSSSFGAFPLPQTLELFSHWPCLSWLLSLCPAVWERPVHQACLRHHAVFGSRCT